MVAEGKEKIKRFAPISMLHHLFSLCCKSVIEGDLQARTGQNIWEKKSEQVLPYCKNLGHCWMLHFSVILTTETSAKHCLCTVRSQWYLSEKTYSVKNVSFPPEPSTEWYHTKSPVREQHLIVLVSYFLWFTAVKSGAAHTLSLIFGIQRVKAQQTRACALFLHIVCI